MPEAKNLGTCPRQIRIHRLITNNYLYLPRHSICRRKVPQKFIMTGSSALQMLNVTPAERTSYFGDLFENMVVNEAFTRNIYEQFDYKFSYLMTKSEVEVDLIVKRPGKPLALVEIKSTNHVKMDDVSSLQAFADDFPEAELFLWSRDPRPQKFGRIQALPWQDGVNVI